MNKITGKGKVTDKDVENILKLSKAGIDRPTISEITGWSLSLVGKVCGGNYYELKEKAKNYYKPKEEVEDEPKQIEEAPTDTAQYVKNINFLLYEIDRKLAAICADLGVTGHENAKADK